MQVKSSDENQSPLVTVIIATRNREQDLGITLRLLRQQIYAPLEVIVVDDASSVSLETVVRREWPEAIFWRNERNLGQSASRTEAMRRAAGKYILLLDDDSCLIESCDLGNAVRRFEDEDDIGIIGFFIHNGESLAELNNSKAIEGIVRNFGAGGALLRKEMIEQVGGFNSFMFLGAEEDELSLRVINAGWKILFLPSIIIHHRVSPVARSEGKTWAYTFRNNIWILVLYMPWRRVALEGAWKLFVGMIDLLRTLEFRWAAWSVWSCLKGLPMILRKRRPISSDTLRHYDLLRIHTVLSREDYESSPAPSISDRWNWFRTTWWHRRRTRPVWDKRPGGIGASSVASFANEHLSGSAKKDSRFS